MSKSLSVLFECNLVPCPSRVVGAACEAVVLPRRSEGDLSEEDGAEPEAQPPSRLPADPARRADDTLNK